MIVVLNKKFIVAVVLLLILAVPMILCIFNKIDVQSSNVVSTATTYPPDTPYHSPERSREELYQDIFLSLLLPYIQNEVDKYYSKYLMYNPLVYPYDVHILSAERLNGYRSFLFRIKLQFYSYVGAHNPVGLDAITLIVGGSGDVQVEIFEHIKSYKLPPNYEDIIRDSYTNPIP